MSSPTPPPTPAPNPLTNLTSNQKIALGSALTLVIAFLGAVVGWLANGSDPAPTPTPTPSPTAIVSSQAPTPVSPTPTVTSQSPTSIPTISPSPTNTLPTIPPIPSPTSKSIGCLPKPSACGYPDVTNTGAKGTLKASGPITSTTDGQVIKDLLVTGYIKVTSANVVIQDVKVVGGNQFGAIDTHSATGHTTVQDVTLVATINQLAGMTIQDTTVIRANISGGQDGIDAWGGLGPSIVQDSFIHSLTRDVADDSHDDTLQTSGGNQTFTHNTLLPYNGVPGAGFASADPMNTCLQVGALQGSLVQLTFSNNLCDGGNYSLNANGSGIGSVLKGSILKAGPMTYTNNRFGTDYRYGVKTHLGSPFNVTWSGNVVDATGAAIP